MKVKLISHTPEPERMVAMSARLCYSPVGAEELVENMSSAQVEKLVSKIVEMEHLSTLEHVSFTFAIEGVSRVLTHQLVRHRIASYSQQSQRYVSEHDFEYIMPPAVAANELAKAKFEELMGTIQSTYNELVELGVHKEDARYCLANAAETKIVVTMNARTLLHFFELRCCARAQWEIRSLAELMLREVKKIAPLLFKKAGPTCITSNYCGEGELTCGRLAAMKGSAKK
ncbi:MULTISPECIES: FAD-dependent thymidylate synthase [Pelosinus]|uniref:Flavin-dependent thymidylate synthase n=1 Tax=Pelosinus fermentans B4 TaxID=1149862 RepID=I8REM5_9FIRM|nr:MULTISPECIES: FAD-dependent thymidylate synthase [Pelosinus]EIW16050.1 thymidylate synthase, flavin-dependent [Pelosinus fermentans B4]EIW25986.1 Thymidylate synthase thyX [Pelosinus fermentans A11]OAM95881.1 Thymidylate synthase thyX [Pelosinus fermentans DSM 17108]SDR33906.1 thymidylate synthase (FAD) [Pelosinus fermentans]